MDRLDELGVLVTVVYERWIVATARAIDAIDDRLFRRRANVGSKSASRLVTAEP
jgi:hypothetical protein